MIEYRVISEKVSENWKSGLQVFKIYFYPQYRNDWSKRMSELRESGEHRNSIIQEEDEEGWMYFHGMTKLDSLESAYEYIDKLKEVNDYGRKIHPYPAK